MQASCTQWLKGVLEMHTVPNESYVLYETDFFGLNLLIEVRDMFVQAESNLKQFLM